MDVYNPQVWEDFGWSVFGEKEVPEKFRLDALVARQYVALVLKRAEQFHKALQATNLEKAPVKFYIIGGKLQANSKRRRALQGSERVESFV